MAVGNIIYSTSSTTIVSGDVINASDFERGTNLQVDTVSGNLNIAGGINTGGTSTLGSASDIKISGGSSGQVLSTDGSSNLSWINTGPVHLGLQPTTSGSIVSFTGIPSWAKRITVIFREIATSAASGALLIQLGTSSGYETSDYYGAFGYSNSGGGAGAGTWSSGMIVGGGDGASGITYNGSIILTRLSSSSNAWNGQSIVSERIGETLLWTGAGSKSLAGTLDRISVSITIGMFTAGSVNVMYE
jgi:hypothetical protein